MIRCACLLETRGDAILLVRVRDNHRWYLPGGTIEDGETEETALVREIREELGVDLDPTTIRYERTIVGPALGRKGKVELICFRGKFEGKPQPLAEVMELGYIPFIMTERMAPAVRLLVADLLNTRKTS